MLVEEQDEIIDMLEKLRDHKQYVPDETFFLKYSFLYVCSTRQQLSQFSTCILSSSRGSVDGDVKMEVDSMASTPLAP
jgi:hypothetical protein